jgi:hypothetical protein
VWLAYRLLGQNLLIRVCCFELCSCSRAQVRVLLV